MSVARKFASKSETVSDLPPSLLYKLAAPSTPESIVTKVIADIKARQPIDRRAVVKEINAHRRLLTHSTSRTEGAPQHKRKKADPAECINRPQEKDHQEADLEDDVREVTVILAKLPKADLIRLGELLKKPDAWSCFVVVLDKAAYQATATILDDYPELPPELDRRSDRVVQEPMEK
jgi:hypothetical protein